VRSSARRIAPAPGRRRVLAAAAGALLLPRASLAQTSAEGRTLGFLGAGRQATGREPGRPLGEMLGHLAQAGWIEGRNLRVVALFNEGQPEALPSLAQQLVERRPDVIVVPNAGVAEAVLRHTTTVPVVAMAAGQLEAEPQVESLRRPGRNLTGMQLHSPEVIGKRLQLLTELVPGLRRVAVLRGVPFDGPGFALYRDANEAAAARLGIHARYLQFRQPDELDALFAGIAAQDQAALTWGNSHLNAQRPQIAALAIKYRVPVMYDVRYLDAGASELIVYGARVGEVWRESASYVDRILRGAKAGELPIGQARSFELMINLRVARAIGLTVPPALLARADEVIR
jgi:putative tryptophan/tyrosine transport system substrate-binding protein